MQRKCTGHIASIRSAITRREEADAQISIDLASWARVDRALNAAQALRDQGLDCVGEFGRNVPAIGSTGAG
jgi:hypothetical protein